ncbi:hypothetical protein QYE76_035698 [Lolium multiflorum]|uniref:CCHC-type domain-containing protein n=1 Tax=Lolium multiflorum TaxID=4521 RepID=A0AAD8R0Z2_LOLMU|nr:hypothetical protein QYE76_035698 [Lolium multiflorum]
MTVGRQAGDAGGDLATQSPATGPPLRDLSSSGALRCGPATSKEPEERPSALSSVVPVEVAGYSSERSFGSRFWALQSGEEGDESDDEELRASGDEESPVREGVSLASYLCRTPSPSQNADLSEDTAELNQRHMKRLRRRDAQRLATRAAIFFSSSAGTDLSSSPVLVKKVRSLDHIKLPVLEPSVFVDDDDGGWTMVHRRRWSPASMSGNRYPGLKENSKTLTVDQARLRAGTQRLGRCLGPKFRQANQPRVRLEGDRVPRVAKVGEASIGFAFRKFLGLTWKKSSAAAPVIRRRTVEIAMSGDGGRGGFNPGRGGFNAGRGGFGGGRGNYGGRGEFGGGRGDFGGRGDHGFGGGRGNFAAGRASYGAGRGGYGNNRSDYGPRGRFAQGAGRDYSGYGTGRGQQGHGFGVGGGNRNFVQGESSGSAGSNYGGNRENSRYGGNQNRWNNGRGGAMANQSRGQVSDGAVRGGIDAALLQQTVEAVVAAVTAATKPKEVVADQPILAVHPSEPAAGVTTVVDDPVAEPMSSVTLPLGTAQSAPQPSGPEAIDKESDGQGASKKKKEEKAGCFRCKKPGHHIDDCPTPFCDICESIHHITSACHLLNAPKPTAILHGYANEGLMFFELACGVFKAKAENPKLAKVTVEDMASSINFNQFLEKEKLKSNGSNFTDWFRHVRIFLNGGNLQYVLDAPLGDPPAETETDEVKNVYMTRKTRLGINRVLQSLPPSYKNFVMNYNMQNMNKEFPELFGMLKAAEIEIKKEHQVLMVNKTTSFKKQGKSKGTRRVARKLPRLP